MLQVVDLKKQEIGGGFAPILSTFVSTTVQLPATQVSLVVPALINATILLLQREIVPYTQAAVPGIRKFSFDTTTGEITFADANPTDAEELYILYYPTPSSGQEIATEPISLGEAKTHLRVTFPDDDVEIYSMISAARQAVEDYCNISIVNKRITLIADCATCWDLPYGPVIALESVVSKTGENYGSVAADSYYLDGDRFERWPAGRMRAIYTTGMDQCPYALKAAILNQISFLYENRGKTADSGVCDQAQQLANPYRKMNWI